MPSKVSPSAHLYRCCRRILIICFATSSVLRTTNCTVNPCGRAFRHRLGLGLRLGLRLGLFPILIRTRPGRQSMFSNAPWFRRFAKNTPKLPIA